MSLHPFSKTGCLLPRFRIVFLLKHVQVGKKRRPMFCCVSMSLDSDLWKIPAEFLTDKKTRFFGFQNVFRKMFTKYFLQALISRIEMFKREMMMLMMLMMMLVMMITQKSSVILDSSFTKLCPQ